MLSHLDLEAVHVDTAAYFKSPQYHERELQLLICPLENQPWIFFVGSYPTYHAPAPAPGPVVCVQAPKWFLQSSDCACSRSKWAEIVLFASIFRNDIDAVFTFLFRKTTHIHKQTLKFHQLQQSMQRSVSLYCHQSTCLLTNHNSAEVSPPNIFTPSGTLAHPIPFLS